MTQGPTEVNDSRKRKRLASTDEQGHRVPFGDLKLDTKNQDDKFFMKRLFPNKNVVLSDRSRVAMLTVVCTVPLGGCAINRGNAGLHRRMSSLLHNLRREDVS